VEILILPNVTQRTLLSGRAYISASKKLRLKTVSKNILKIFNVVYFTI